MLGGLGCSNRIRPTLCGTIVWEMLCSRATLSNGCVFRQRSKSLEARDRRVSTVLCKSSTSFIRQQHLAKQARVVGTSQ